MTWERQLYEQIRKNYDVGEEFDIEFLYSLASYFKKERPENQNIEATIRDVAQNLRDKDKIRFLDYEGTYVVLS